MKQYNITKEFTVDKLKVIIFENRIDAGNKAAEDIAAAMKEVLQYKDEVNIILGAAPSQDDLYRGLLAQADIPWEKVNGFHMDEYIGLSTDAPQAFGRYLRDRLYGKVPMKSVHFIDSETDDTQKEMERYTELLRSMPADIVCIGIGENGHIAFNDPPANFTEPLLVKKIAMEERSRQQQVNDGCFASLSAVPTHAITLTIPALVTAKYLFCVVPATTKAEAVCKTLEEPISESCPASIIRTHDHCTLYLDPDSSARLTIY